MTSSSHRDRPLALFLVFLKLGCTAFGGPVAHLGYYHDEFVRRRRWLSEAAYADLVALCQFLPGPASSQVGIATGLLRGGLPGALVAWLGFTLPAALIMLALGYGLTHFAVGAEAGWLRGLKLVTAAVVAQALWSMARRLCTDWPRRALALAAALAMFALPLPLMQVGVIGAGALAGLLVFPAAPAPEALAAPRMRRRSALVALALFAALLLGLPLLNAVWPSAAGIRFESFYRAGALVFGGGHVVLPLLQAEVVPNGWVGQSHFLAGYGAAQAIPGPLFAFAAYLGAAMSTPPAGVAGAALCLVGVFAPGFLLVVGALPFWARLRERPALRAAMAGASAAVVGLLAAAFVDPILTQAIRTPADVGLALAALGLLTLARWPPWVVVGLSAGVGQLVL